MNDAIREAATVDPAWARAEQRKLWLLKAVTLAVLVALGIGTVALVFGIHNETKLTKIEQTPCAKDPNSRACQQLRAEVEEHANVRVNCIPFHRAGYECPKPGSALAEEQEEVMPSKPESGTSLSAPPSTGAPEQPVQAPAESPPPAAAPANVSPALEGVTETVCSVNALGLRICE